VSSHQGSGDDTPIVGVDQLVAYHAKGERPRGEWKIGTEHEKFAFSLPDRRPLQYRGEGGKPGILSLLNAMQSCCGWQPLVDNGEIIALSSADGSIALEPGGQVEMSGRVLSTVHETRAELDRHLDELAQLSAALPVKWLWMGHQPVHLLDEIGWMPKRRYGIMREYLPTRGHLARYMMQATCTVQANLDYGDESDMGRKMRLAMGLSSIVTAMFAHSPLKGGRPSGYKSLRARVWEETDPDRSGLLPFYFTGDGPTYEEYARWALDVPMFFFEREGEYVACAGLPFRQFWEQGFQGHRATMADWELHLSTLFPDVRLKTYIETRTTDIVPPDLVCALPALWKGVLYDDDASLAAWDLVRRWSFVERQQHRVDVAVSALQARTPGGFLTASLAQELLAIARYGLTRQAEAAGHPDEGVHLDALEALVSQGRCPADVILEWVAEQRPTPEQILDRFLI